MSALRLLPGILLLVIAGMWLGARALPGEYTIASELDIDAPPPRVFDQVNSAADWTKWFTGPESDAEVQGQGRLVLVHEGVAHVLELTETSSPTQVRFRHSTEGSGLEPVEGRLDIEARTGGSRVRIQEVVTVQSSTQRWLVWLFGEELMNQVLARELHNLKGVVERPTPAGGGG